jgi:Cytochrome C'
MKAPSVAFFVCIAACQSPVSSPAPPAARLVARVAESTLTAADALDRLDSRKPVPLMPMMAQHQKQNMREHLEAVQEVVVAAAAHDFAKVAASAKRMGYSEVMGQMCEHMGSGAPGFAEQALAFHHSADRISEAAAKKDSAAVLAALGETLTTCTSCHATYKQKLVDTLK